MGHVSHFCAQRIFGQRASGLQPNSPPREVTEGSLQCFLPSPWRLSVTPETEPVVLMQLLLQGRASNASDVRHIKAVNGQMTKVPDEVAGRGLLGDE